MLEFENQNGSLGCNEKFLLYMFLKSKGTDKSTVTSNNKLVL